MSKQNFTKGQECQRRIDNGLKIIEEHEEVDLDLYQINYLRAEYLKDNDQDNALYELMVNAFLLGVQAGYSASRAEVKASNEQ